ncbi:MAG: hypothetical protein HQ515_10750 [Phycisphaeraceae bacterium]|nr:hypothetical protein [Phycisphaeraceae bacterium]
MSYQAYAGHSQIFGQQYIRANLFVGLIVLIGIQTLAFAENASPFATMSDLQNSINGLSLPALRSAIEDLTQTYPHEYVHGKVYLKRLNTYEQQIVALASHPRTTDKAWQNKATSLVKDLTVFRQEVLLANPLLARQPILFIARRQYKSDHHNTATMFQTGEINTGSFVGGSALKTIDLVNGGRIQTLIESKDALIRDPELSFDGTRILFSMRKNIKDNYHIYEIHINGAHVRQLTSAPGVTDIDPLYLPGGDIVFSSTREPKYCMCNRHIMCNLFRMDRDGANIIQLGKSTLHEGHSTLLPDGRILYDRWEYVDRNFGDAQALWTVNPDGTNHAIYWGNNTWSPGGAIDGRAIPGTDKVICIFGSCHDRPWGALAIVDHALGVDGKTSVERTWPADAIDLVQDKSPKYDAYGFDNFKRVNPKYEDPYPLSESYFLCSRGVGKGELMGIYLIDVFGNEIQVHVEEPGCYSPMPLNAKPEPPRIPARRNFKQQVGYFYISDVYEGTHMQRVEPGSIKYLRVVESPEKRHWTHTQWGGQGVHCPAMNWHSFENKRILGTVPVEADGSAYFEVPGDTFVYFQLLDKDKMMIQSMRSGTMVQSGELTGCVGCHEDRNATPPPSNVTKLLAIKRPPSKLQGWKGETRIFSYLRDVQPVLTKHCASCHDYGTEAGAKLVLAPDQTNTFNASYRELWLKKYIKTIGAGPANTQPAYSWGSHASKLVEVIQSGHEEVKLSQDDMERITTWIDLNGTYYPHYSSAYPNNLSGRSPLNNQQIQRLKTLTGVPLDQLNRHNSKLGPQVSFARPEKSPCLASIKDKNGPEYQEAIDIITAGMRQLQTRPRADMEGYVPCEVDQQREQKYAKREQIEYQNRQALETGTQRRDK